LVGPAYSTTDSRFSRNFRVTNNVHLSLIIEAFNLFNHLNKRVLTDAGGFVVNTTQFVPFSQRSGATYYPRAIPPQPFLDRRHRRICTTSSASRGPPHFLTCAENWAA